MRQLARCLWAGVAFIIWPRYTELYACVRGELLYTVSNIVWLNTSAMFKSKLCLLENRQTTFWESMCQITAFKYIVVDSMMNGYSCRSSVIHSAMGIYCCICMWYVGFWGHRIKTMPLFSSPNKKRQSVKMTSLHLALEAESTFGQMYQSTLKIITYLIPMSVT